MIWLRKYARLTAMVRDFHVRPYRQKTSSATVSNSFSSPLVGEMSGGGNQPRSATRSQPGEPEALPPVDRY